MGIVTFYDDRRCYGIITPNDGGDDVFVHLSAIGRAGVSTLREGDQLSFNIEPDRRGPQAVDLKRA